MRKNQLKLTTGASQTRHDSADRNAGDISDLFIRCTFEFTEHDRFPEFWGQLLDRRAHGLPILRAIDCDAGFHRGRLFPVQLFFEFDIHFIGSVLFQSRVSDIANDFQKPGAAVFAAKIFEKAKGADRRVLNNVLGILIVAHEKPGEIVGRIEVRQHLTFEFAQAR